VRAACVVAMLAAACVDRAPGVRVERAALVIPAGGSLAMLYLTVHNHTGRADTIRALRIDDAGGVSLHTPREHATGVLEPGTEARMVPLPPNSTVRFSPGGLHAMVQVTGLPMRRGSAVRLVLHRTRGDSTVSAARVVAYADLDSVLAPPSRWQRLSVLASGWWRATSGSHCAEDDPPSAAMGRELYRASGCGSCHGPVGRGDGPVAKTLAPPPRDLRDAAAFKAGASVDAIAQSIGMGIPGGGAMPAHPHLNASERQSLALYILSLRLPSQPRNLTP